MRVVDLVNRRLFIKAFTVAGIAALGGTVMGGCGMAESGYRSGQASRESKGQAGDTLVVARELPPAIPDLKSEFDIDSSVTVKCVDEWLDRDDVVYRDVRMLSDSADFGAIGGDPNLTATVEGFKIVPFPLIGTLPPLPVMGAYEGSVAWAIEWSDEGTIVSATPRYEESTQLLEDLFPQDKAIFLMCGAGAYASFTKKLLVFLGWDEERVFNIGGFWSYKGKHSVSLIVSDERAAVGQLNLVWRAEVAPIDFSMMHEK